MAPREWVDIHERKHLVAFKYFNGRNFSVYDFTEHAIGFGSHPHHQCSLTVTFLKNVGEIVLFNIFLYRSDFIQGLVRTTAFYTIMTILNLIKLDGTRHDRWNEEFTSSLIIITTLISRHDAGKFGDLTMDDKSREINPMKDAVGVITGSKNDVDVLGKPLLPKDEQVMQEKLMQRLEQVSDEQERLQIIQALVELGDNRVWIHPDARNWLQKNFSSFDIGNLSYAPELLDVISRTLTGSTDAETKRKLIISLGHWSEELCWQIHSPDRAQFYTWSKKWLRNLTRDDLAMILENDSMKQGKKIEFVLSLGKLPLGTILISELLILLRSEKVHPKLRHAALVSLLHQPELPEDVQEFVIRYIMERDWEELEDFMAEYCPMHCFDCIANGIAALDSIPRGFESIILKLIKKSSGVTGDLLLNQLECLLHDGLDLDKIVEDLEDSVLDKQLPARTRHRVLLILGTYFINRVNWTRIMEEIQRENDPTLVSSLIHVLAENDDVDIEFFNKFLKHENFVVRHEAHHAIAKKR